MINELIFFAQTMLVSAAVLGALVLGREALIACISLLFVLANLFVVKQITLFGFEVTAADVYVVGAVLGFNLLQEYFGKKIARKTIWISFFVSLVCVVMSQLHLGYIPNAYDATQGAFTQILGVLPRLLIASFATHIIVQYFRLFFYGLLKKRYGSRHLVSRHFVVTTIEQIIDTGLFGFIGLYGVVHALTDVFVVSFCIKLVAIACTAPWLAVARVVMRRWGPKYQGARVCSFDVPPGHERYPVLAMTGDRQREGQA